MQHVLNVNLGDHNFANSDEPISESVFGAEFLGWEFFSNFENRYEQIGFHHFRWPGGIPIEDGVNADESEDGSRDVVYDLRFENLVDWDRKTGAPREGIREMLDYAVQNDLSFAMVAPTARYVETILQYGEKIGLQAAREDIRYFVERLVQGDYGDLPSKFSLEIGSEYYSTDVWKEQTTNEEGIPYTIFPEGLSQKFGKVFAAIVDEIDQVLNDPYLNPGDVDIEIAVQAGRIGADVFQNGGLFSDNIDFIEALMDVGSLDAVDALIYHRYVPTFDNIGRGILRDANGHKLGDAIDLWQEVSGGKEFDLIAGYLSPAAQSVGKLEYNAPGLANILQINALLLAEGLDAGTLFGLGHSSGGALAWRSNVFLGGQLYDLMAESIPGKFLHDGFQANTSNVMNLGESYVVSDDINSYVFENDDEIAVFLTAKDFLSESLEYTLNFDTQFSVGEITHLWDSGEYIESASNNEVIGHFGETSSAPAQLRITETGTEISVVFTHDYEVIRLVIDKHLQGSDGNDEIDGFDTVDQISGGFGNDVIHGFSESDTINGDQGNDVIFGGSGDDRLEGGLGNDSHSGGLGDDIFIGGAGADAHDGGDGFDVVDYSAATSRIKIDLSPAATQQQGDATGDTFTSIEEVIGTAFGDIYVGDTAHNRFIGGSGNDFLKSGFGQDKLFGNDGNDHLNGGKSRDRLEGGRGDDYLTGLKGKDRLEGGQGNDTLLGGDNDDILQGGQGMDTLDGGSGIDRIDGGTNNDLITGGSGADTFFFKGNHGQDTITDFDALDDAEKIDFSDVSTINSVGDLLDPGGAASQVGANVLINSVNGFSILLENVDFNDLDNNDFLF